MTTIQCLLDDSTAKLAKNSDSPRLDSEVLLAFVLQKNRSYLRAWHDKSLQLSQLESFDLLLKQRLAGTPIAYLTGTREFWSREFLVSEDVLIPRPDTETLIEHCLTFIPEKMPFKVLDLGTGSGIIAITLASECPKISVTAVDFSKKALEIAQKNAELHHCKNVKFVLSDWFSAISGEIFDLIVSNPPYIAVDDEHLAQGDVRFEPKSALISENNGLKDITLITNQAKNYLVRNGKLAFEHGYNQADKVQVILKEAGFINIQTIFDLAGQPRVTTGCS